MSKKSDKYTIILELLGKQHDFEYKKLDSLFFTIYKIFLIKEAEDSVEFYEMKIGIYEEDDELGDCSFNRYRISKEQSEYFDHDNDEWRVYDIDEGINSDTQFNIAYQEYQADKAVEEMLTDEPKIEHHPYWAPFHSTDSI